MFLYIFILLQVVYSNNPLAKQEIIQKALSQMQQLQTHIQQIPQNEVKNQNKGSSLTTPMQDLIQGQMNLTIKSPLILKTVCKLCNTTFGYIIDEDNSQIIGLTHGYKKEFQFLIDQIRKQMGEGTYYLAFSEQNNPCIASDNLKSLIILDDVLMFFTEKSLHNFQEKEQLFTFSKEIQAAFFQVMAIYNHQQRIFYFQDFKLLIKSEFVTELARGIHLKSKNIEFIEENHVVNYTGLILVGQDILEFYFESSNNNQKSKMVINNMFIPDQKEMLMVIAKRYFGKYFQEAIDKHIKGLSQLKNPLIDRMSHSYRANLHIQTQVTDQQFQIKLHLKKMKN